MTESKRTTSDQEKARNVDMDPMVEHSDMQRSTSSSPVGVYDQSTTATKSASTSTGNMTWIILLIVLIIVAFFILRRWM